MIAIPCPVKLLHGPGPVLLESLKEARIDALAEGVEPIGADAECALDERFLLVEDLDQVGNCAGVKPGAVDMGMDFMRGPSLGCGSFRTKEMKEIAMG